MAALAHDGVRDPVTILVVDDDHDVRGIVAEFLGQSGYDVLEAPGGQEALAVLEQRPDVRMVITDIRMPDMSGIELADRAEGMRSDLKIILVSGYFSPQHMQRRFLRKPFRMKDLETAVRDALVA